MQKILVLKGLPGSGKSHFAKELISREPGKWKRVNKDDLRAMIDNSHWSKHNEEFVLLMRDTLIDNALQEEYSVIVDDTNFAEKHLERIEELAKIHEAEVIVRFFDTPLDVCIERDAKRVNPVGAKVISDMNNKYLRKEYEYRKYDTSKEDAIIVDIDGTMTLWKKDHRSYYDYSKVLDDRPNEPVIRLVKMLAEKYKVIFVSGRPDICEFDTIEWIDAQGIKDFILYMRKIGDFREDSIIKKEIFDEHIAPLYNIKYVLDDRLRVRRMWYSLGLPLLSIGDPDADF